MNKMPYYTSPINSELAIPSNKNYQPPRNKLRTESINSGDIHSIYDTTLLTGTNRIKSIEGPIWASQKTAPTGVLNEQHILVNEDHTIVTSVTNSANIIDFYNSSSSYGNNSFTPNPPNKAGTFPGAATIFIQSPEGEVLKFAGVKTTGSIYFGHFIAKQSDGGYCLVLNGIGDPTIYDAGTVMTTGNLLPTPITHNTISMGGLNYVMIVKYSSDLKAEWVNFISTSGSNTIIADYTIDPSGNLILLVRKENDTDFYFYDRMLPDDALPTPLSNVSVFYHGGLISKFSNTGEPLWFTKVGVTNYIAFPISMTSFKIGSDNTGAVLFSFTANITKSVTTDDNFLELYDSGDSGNTYTPSISGKFVSDGDSYYAVIVKYDSDGKVEWVNKNDIHNNLSYNMGLVIDTKNSVYINYDVPTVSPSDVQIINGTYTPPIPAGGLFAPVDVIGTVPTSEISSTGIYQIVIKYDSSGFFQWLSVIVGQGSVYIYIQCKPILLRSGDVLSAYVVRDGSGTNIYKRSLAPSTKGGEFSLIEDITLPNISNFESNIVVRRNSDGDNIWASMYDMGIYMIAEDPAEHLYYSGNFYDNDFSRIFDAGTSQKSMTLAGTIPSISSSYLTRGLVVAVTSKGIVRWITIIESLYLILKDIRINVSTYNIMISFPYDSPNIEIPVVISNKIQPIGGGEFAPDDSAGSIDLINNYTNFLINLSDFTPHLIHPSYNLMYPNNNNKTIINTSTSDAVIYGRGLLINKRVKVYEVVLGPWATISLVSMTNGERSGIWIVSETYGDVVFS